MPTLFAEVTATPDDVVAGVDTHKDTHHVAVLALNGAHLGDRQVPATTAGYDELARFVASFGTVRVIGVEGTNSYGAGLSRHLAAAGATVIEVIRPKRAEPGAAATAADSSASPTSVSWSPRTHSVGTVSLGRSGRRFSRIVNGP